MSAQDSLYFCLGCDSWVQLRDLGPTCVSQMSGGPMPSLGVSEDTRELATKRDILFSFTTHSYEPGIFFFERVLTLYKTPVKSRTDVLRRELCDLTATTFVRWEPISTTIRAQTRGFVTAELQRGSLLRVSPPPTFDDRRLQNAKIGSETCTRTQTSFKRDWLTKSEITFKNRGRIRNLVENGLLTRSPTARVRSPCVSEPNLEQSEFVLRSLQPVRVNPFKHSKTFHFDHTYNFWICWNSKSPSITKGLSDKRCWFNVEPRNPSHQNADQ